MVKYTVWEVTEMFVMQDTGAFKQSQDSYYFNTFVDGTFVSVEARDSERFVMFSKFFGSQGFCVLNLLNLKVVESDGFNPLEICNFVDWCRESYQQLMTVALAI